MKTEGTATDSRPRSSFGHYLPRLRREFYQADAVVFWTLTVNRRQTGWLTEGFHRVFRELMLHVAAREGLLCPAYCLMTDHVHLVWMGLRVGTDQRNGMTFLRTRLSEALKPAQWQHQAHDHVLTRRERARAQFAVACTDYVLLNPVKAGMVTRPSEWRYCGAVVPGYFAVDPFDSDFWPWFWERYATAREEGIEKRVLPPRQME